MGREIPGSFLEQHDGRTWDETLDRDQPFSALDNDYADDDGLDDDDDEPTTLDEWLGGWAEPASVGAERALLAELDLRIKDLGERIYYRNMAARAGAAVDMTTADSDEALQAELLEFQRRHRDPGDDDEAATSQPPPASGPDAAPKTTSRPSRVRQVEIAINERLTPSELLHWQELQKGTTQIAIAKRLGMKQAAVSKREHKLRDRVNAISIETIGRPYPERLVDRGMWARQGRRRNKTASRQR